MPNVLQPAIDRLFNRLEPMGHTLEFAMKCLFVEAAFAQRIRNALELKSHADSVTNQAIALSLCVSALEAILCEERKEKNSGQLQKRIPALLKADQKLAKDSAGAIRALYKVRNRCLHGQVVLKSHDVSAVRRLFGAVLRGALEWAVSRGDAPSDADETERMSELESEWKKVLKDATVNPDDITHIPGVTKDLHEHLHAFTTAFGKDRLSELFDGVEDE